MRKVQLAELRRRERNLGAGVEDHTEGEYLYLGERPTRGQLMIAPRLEQYVAYKMGGEGNIMKERHGLREEQVLARPRDVKGKCKGKGAGAGDGGQAAAAGSGV